MGMMIIDGMHVEFTDEANVLDVIRKAGIDLPTLCYVSELSVYGACRLCTVKDDEGRYFASCTVKPRDGMNIQTNTPELHQYRRLLVELLLAAHDRDCTTCHRNGTCQLQELAERMGMRHVRFKSLEEEHPVDLSSNCIVRDPNKCILCGDCIRMCDNVQSVNAIDFAGKGVGTLVTPAYNKKLADTDCVDCGQCRVVCPTGALTIHHNMTEVWNALGDKNTRVVAQIAPAVRVAVSEAFGLPKGENSMGKIVAALHRMGFDEVYDTTYTADLTIMEESAEFLDRVANGGTLPLLTSCCPAWVKFVENEYPEFKQNISTCRSPQQMFSAILKDYYRDEANAQGKKTFVVSIMPCTAKKMEAERPNSYTNGVKDTDAVLTTTEVIRLIQQFGLNFANLPEEACDMPFGLGSGSAMIYGTTGGVAEAVARYCLPDKSKNTLRKLELSPLRGEESIREATLKVGEAEIRIAVVHGLAYAQELLKKIEAGEVDYHLIEVMTCPTGCVGGAGQPIGRRDKKLDRAAGLYTADKTAIFKRAEYNPVMDDVLEGYSEEQLHHLLHVHYGEH